MDRRELKLMTLWFDEISAQLTDEKGIETFLAIQSDNSK